MTAPIAMDSDPDRRFSDGLPSLSVSKFGPIEEAHIEFGDLTVFVGPQATGKSIVLQLWKLLLDAGAVLSDLKRYGFDWRRELPTFLGIFFGQGMQSLWRKDKTSILSNGREIDLVGLIRRQRRSKDEHVFFIPAQRVLTVSKGWPRSFSEFSAGDPFAVRDFSEKLRILMEIEFGQKEALFPEKRRLKTELRDTLEKAIFGKFGLSVAQHHGQKELVLSDGSARQPLPFMVWSSGQREFVPLLLGLYWLLPPTRTSRREKIEWVVIEEPEMGLHPQAISAVILVVLELLWRGYRVCLSTHSPHVLDLVWAIQQLRENEAAPKQLLSLFDCRNSPPMQSVAEKVLQKTTKVYYFERDTGRTLDISSLNPGDRDPAIAGWGGLTEFSGRVADVVADAVQGNRT